MTRRRPPDAPSNGAHDDARDEYSNKDAISSPRTRPWRTDGRGSIEYKSSKLVYPPHAGTYGDTYITTRRDYGEGNRGHVPNQR